MQKADGADGLLAGRPVAVGPGARSSMTWPTPNQSTKNAAAAAHRIDLLLGRQNGPFLTVSLGKDPEDRHHHIHGEARETAQIPKRIGPAAIGGHSTAAPPPATILTAREVQDPGS